MVLLNQFTKDPTDNEIIWEIKKVIQTLKKYIYYNVRRAVTEHNNKPPAFEISSMMVSLFTSTKVTMWSGHDSHSGLQLGTLQHKNSSKNTKKKHSTPLTSTQYTLNKTLNILTDVEKREKKTKRITFS